MRKAATIDWDHDPSIDGNGSPYIRGFVDGEHRWMVVCAGDGRVSIYGPTKMWTWSGGFARGKRKAEREESRLSREGS